MLWNHHVTLVLLTLFSWPAGIVLGNLLASLLWVPVQWLGIRARLAAHHAEVHARLDDQDAYILQRFDSQDAVLNEITELLRSSSQFAKS